MRMLLLFRPLNATTHVSFRGSREAACQSQLTAARGRIIAYAIQPTVSFTSVELDRLLHTQASPHQPGSDLLVRLRLASSARYPYEHAPWRAFDHSRFAKAELGDDGFRIRCPTGADT